jgi:hypothetical protein
MSKFRKGAYEIYGIGENGKRVLMGAFTVKDDFITYLNGYKSDIFAEGKIDSQTDIRLRRFLNDQHGYCVVIPKRTEK